MASVWPLVGRREELQLVVETLRDRRSAALVIAGEAGVGKSRLLAEAVTCLAAEGRLIKMAVATHAATAIPFGAVAHLLPSSMPGGSGNLLRVAGDALVNEAGESTMILAIDDAHLLDSTSAALLHHLALERRADLLLTVRSREPAPDLIIAMWKDSLAERVELQPLSRGEVEEVIAAVLGSPVDGRTTHRLWQMTRGNVLYLRELVLSGLETRALRSEQGVWRWTGELEWGSRLSALLDARLEGLDADERGALEIVAASEPVEVSLVETSVSSTAIEWVERRGLVQVMTDGRRLRLRMSHPLYGESVREATPITRKRAILHDLSMALARTGRRREDMLRRASWTLDAIDVDASLFMEAARSALVQRGFDLAERLARAAMQARVGFAAEYLLAEVLSWTGRLDEADRLLASLMDSPHTEDERMRALVQRLVILNQGLGRPHEAWKILADAERTITDPNRRQELQVLRGQLLHLDGRIPHALEVVLELVRRNDVVEDTRVMAATMAAWALNLSGRHTGAIRLIDDTLDVAARAAEQNAFLGGMVHSLRFHRAAALLFSGVLEEAESALSGLYEEALGRGDEDGRTGAAMFLSLNDRLSGRPRSAARRLQETIGVLRTVDAHQRRRRTLGELAQCLALVGDTKAAGLALEEGETALSSARIFEWEFQLGRVWTAAALGETSNAVAIALETADLCAAQGHRVGEAAALHDAARLGASRQVAPRLIDVAGRVDGPLTPAYAAHAAALASVNAGALERSSSEFEEIGTILLAAEAAAEAATTYRASGRRGSAMAATARATALAAKCEGARTPAIADLEPLPLTRREREIATMAARRPL
jgi:AAA ATPase domain